MPSPTTWVLIADATSAKIYVNRGRGSGLEPLPHGELAGVNAHTRDLVSDRPGRAFDSHGAGRHSMEPPTDPHEHEKARFIERLSDFLAERAERGGFDQLVVVAPPRALGLLRDKLTPAVAKRVVHELHKDLIPIPEHELAGHLAEVVTL